MTKSEHFLLVYGSLLSSDSRHRHSNIQGSALPVTVAGWQRGWHTRSWGEKQTYVGAVSAESALMNGALVPIQAIDPQLQQREQDYQFVSVCQSRITVHGRQQGDTEVTDKIGQATVWLCESREVVHADEHHPVCLSYIDTCLAGCLESSGEVFAREFIASTLHWDTLLVDDRQQPRYPRAGRVNTQIKDHIDGLLKDHGIQTHKDLNK